MSVVFKASDEPGAIQEEDRASVKSLHNDLLASLLVLLLTLMLFVPAVSDIYIDPRDVGFSARDFPVGVLGLLVILSGTMLVRNLYALGRHKQRWNSYYSGETHRLVRYVIPMMILGYAYAWLISLFQYFLPTLLITALALALYGNRGWLRLVLVPLVVACFYYLLFYGLLGLYEEPGTVLTFNNLEFFGPLRKALGLL